MTTAPATTPSASRGRIIAARVLLVLGVLLTVVSILSTYVKREALDEGQFKGTVAGADREPADPAAGRRRHGRRAVFERRRLERSCRASCRRTCRALAAPIAGLSRRARRPRGARAPRPAPRPERVRRALHGRAGAVRRRCCTATRKCYDTSNGDVVLDLRPLVLRLGDRFGFVEQPRATRSRRARPR